jgi:NAD(P)-dependent dehydrogenase (short-subunit alcohol dehydrogenase family)
MNYPLPNFSIDLNGQVALVTGASGGLGRRFAEVLASAGAAVALTGRRLDKLESLQNEIHERGGKAIAIPLDVRDPDVIIRAVDQAEQQLGLINILVNNSGITDANWATKMSLELIDDVINTNFRAPFLVAREVARRLIDAKQPGRIVNISSVGAYHYNPSSAASLYSATKSGVLRMTETLAMEWAKFGINVNAIAPGLFRSGMSEAYLNSVGDVATKHYPRKRVGEPPQLDSTLLYLVSPSSEFVTGICIRVDDAQMPR